MKTITHYKSQQIAGRVNAGAGSALHTYSLNGKIVDSSRSDYHLEIDMALALPYKWLKKDYEALQQLKNYFTQWAPVIARDPANIKTIQYHSSVPGYEYENTIFDITWNELIIYFPGEHSKQSISLKDAKLLALEILKY